MPASSILLLETDPIAGEAIRTVLDGVGYAVVIVNDSGRGLLAVPPTTASS